jgi:signal transduction histidine kinase
LPSPAQYALYPASGRALLSPWREQPPVPPEIVGRRSAVSVVATPAGLAWAFAELGADGYEVLFLPRLRPGEALERVGSIAASVLALLALGTAAALLLALPRPAFRDLLSRTVRSYSRRLLLVYTALLLLPLLLLNFVLLRTVETRLSRDQRAQGEQALTAAQRAVVDRILSQPPGFGLDTALGPDYLNGLSRLVDHDVNLYFGSEFLSSSSGELFTAGLLPRRIPGEIYSRLALLGFGIAARTNRVVDTPYLELYSPVSLPDEPLEEPRIFLSVPLLAQQEETAGALAAMRRRALVASTALFALLIAVGNRLARNFTRPLADLVAGTRRIAAGARSLDLAPTELELAALVEAVDDMARRIAQGREELLREKALVERMVENITSGVVSLDAEGRVLMHNRAAAELLGARVGEPLSERQGGSGRLARVAAFASAAARRGSSQPVRETVRFATPGEAATEWTLVWVPLPAAGEPTALLVVEDVTEIFRGQRLAAWAEMARIIAHEIKNPLTPVRLSAEHMQQVYRTDPERFGEIFERCTANILQQVDELQQIASEFSTYSRIPRIELQRSDLVDAMAAVVEAYRAAPPKGIEVAFIGGDGPVFARFDERLLGRAVRNLVENALRATGEGGRVEVRVGRRDGWASVVVSDTGPGVPADLLGRIFEPYFSTHSGGTGLGLPIARRIAEEHGGEIVASNRPLGGLAVEIKIPLA